VPKIKRNTIRSGQSCFEINPVDFTEVAPGILVLELSSPKHHHQHPKVINEIPTKWLAVPLVATDTARTRYVAEVSRLFDAQMIISSLERFYGGKKLWSDARGGL
jgi:hypothetical protein